MTQPPLGHLLVGTRLAVEIANIALRGITRKVIQPFSDHVGLVHSPATRGAGEALHFVRGMFHMLMMSRIKVDTVTHLSKHQYWMRFKCRCGHEVALSAAQLMIAMRGKRVSTNLDDIAAHARCTVCKRRGVSWSVTLPMGHEDKPLISIDPAPIGVDQAAWTAARDDRERKRLIQRARG